MSEALHDAFGRPLASLRVSVTDRCNMRCRYCMPEDEYVWLPRESILTFEEIARLAQVFAGLGVHKVRLTGGEPLLRQDLATLVEMITRVGGLTDLALTTNGLLLAKQAAELRRAGLRRVLELRPHSDHVDRVGQALEPNRPALDVLDAVHLASEVRDLAAGEDLSRTGERAEPRRKIERPAPKAPVDRHRLAGV